MKLRYFILMIGMALSVATVYAQKKKESSDQNSTLVQDSTKQNKSKLQSQQSITHGYVLVNGKRIDYDAATGTLVLKNEKDLPTVSMSYVAYFKKDEKDISKRPITFLYNGGPGSSTVWLHMGCWGPQKVNIEDMSRSRAPYSTVNNEYSLLNATDLVFIDAPGTGFGEVLTKEMGGAGEPKDFFGIDEDGQAFADFIAQFITDFNRWNSPKYLFGESYGTFRSAIVANILQRSKNISLNGIILLSQLLTYSNMTETTVANPGADLPFMLVLPSFAATAYYHHKLPSQPNDLTSFLREVENFAITDYALALNKGADLDETTLQATAEKLHQYTGLSVSYLKKANLRVRGPQFSQALLGDSSLITGRLDSRFVGDAMNPLSENAQYDPMNSFIAAAFTATLNNYIRNDLKFGGNREYKISGNVRPWNFQRKGFFIGFPNVMNDLAQAMIYNPSLKVMLTGGYFDLGTPYFEGIYEMKHLPVPAALQKNISYHYYPSGHMIYLHPESLKQLHEDVTGFINGTN